ncbi:hypothetical protein FSARC_13316 [Fusarium sarcochroum]|uniref:Uncharacterized protein n=1 Tax=Fusarium sarcochroum TaxID=1208366 RepID=A0A8H4WTS0_9HYPO|nr:hypothetical protein FSARC_13316 [Fusarium sarcochroum]
MRCPTILAGITAFTSAAAATVKTTPHVSITIMTVNRPAKDEKSTLPLSVPPGVLTHQKNIKITELEISHVYSNVRGVKAPSSTRLLIGDRDGPPPMKIPIPEYWMLYIKPYNNIFHR